MTTTADQVVRALREHLAATPISAEDRYGEHDVFTPSDSVETLEGQEADRRFAIQVVSGPDPVPAGSRCRDRMRLAVGVRYFQGLESQYRCLRDLPLVRHQLRTLPGHASLAGADVRVQLGTTNHDYTTLSKTDLVVFDVTVDYHVSTQTGGN